VLVSPYALSVHGGVQEQVVSMSRTLANRGHDVLVITADESDSSFYDTPATVVQLGALFSLPANGSRAPITLSRQARRAALRAVADFDPDIVHVHEPFAPMLGYRILASHRWPTVATFHRSGGFSWLRYCRRLFRWGRAGIDRAVSVSNAAAATAEHDFGISTEVEFNGIDVMRLRRAARHKPAQTTIVTVGRLEERKGVATLIEAVLLHNEQRPDDSWLLDIVGAGPERQRLEALAQGSDRIRFRGALDHERKNELLRSASVVVCPALRGESFGIVLLEAMACEVPVVASAIDGYRQAAGGHCFLTPPGEASALESTIAGALHASSSWVADAAAYASQWSMDALVDLYETHYQEAIDRFVSR